MNAAVLRNARDIVIKDVPEPVVEPDGVIIKVKACGICGSDLHLYKTGAPAEWIPGHEFSGDIVDVGSRVTGVKTGDRVVAMCGRGCGECCWCRQGQWLRCSRMSLLGYGIPGAFAEYVSVPYFQLDTYAARLPDSLSYEVGATAEPLSVALYSVSRAQPNTGDTVVVIGLGIIGLCIIQVLKTLGITGIIVSGRRSVRLKLAKTAGADTIINAASDNIVPVVQEKTSSKSADIVFECAGTAETFEQSFRMVHNGGKVALVGLYEQPVTWNPATIVSHDIDIIGCGLRFDLPGAIDLITSGQVDTEPYISHEFPLEGIREAFETQLTADDAVKVLVKP